MKITQRLKGIGASSDTLIEDPFGNDSPNRGGGTSTRLTRSRPNKKTDIKIKTQDFSREREGRAEREGNNANQTPPLGRTPVSLRRWRESGLPNKAARPLLRGALRTTGTRLGRIWVRAGAQLDRRGTPRKAGVGETCLKKKK